MSESAQALVDRAAAEAGQAIERISRNDLNPLIVLMQLLEQEELTLCGSAIEEVVWRRAQGKAAAYRQVTELLRHADTQPRRAVSRQEV